MRVIFATAITMVLAGTASAQSFQNGSFESVACASQPDGCRDVALLDGDQSITGWTVVAPGSNRNINDLKDGDYGSHPSAGSYALDLTGGSGISSSDYNNNGVRQTFTTIAGDTYALSFDVGANNYTSRNGAFIEAFINGISLGLFGNTNTGTTQTWATAMTSFLASSDSTTLTLIGRSDDSPNHFDGSAHNYYTGLDNVKVSDLAAATPGAVPEPAAWAMMIGGFGMVGGALRRRRVAVRTAIA